MSDATESSSSTPIVTVHTKSSTNLPMGFKLNGSNYEIWASMIELHATTQGKLGYLTGDTDAPDSQDPKYGKWKIADAIVKSWMLQTMEPNTGMLDCKPADTSIVENHKLGVYVDQKNGHLDLEGYTNADYAGNITDRRSTSGYFTFVGGNLVTCRSKKQNVVSRSSAESEYRGIAQGVCEILWLRWLLAEIGFRPDAATKLYCDNHSAFEIANILVQHDRTKHVEVDRHFIK
ncbi:uncharacterized protein LOC110746726 [Prunus avium]|uniref:Uncharacterized protein LOC110746726 n=1 Tax=Prunus avium TaxID=42229 RepID=A0A6P5RI61_PRUAV|nr:uncharacterized protein LOC110746726 [Prunus avium]